MSRHPHPASRSERRAAAKRRQAAQTRFYLRTLGQYQGVESVPDALRLGRQNRDLRCPCSCPLCGNPRRHFGTPTVGELREAEAGVRSRDLLSPPHG